MSPRSGRTLGIGGWLVAASVAVLYLTARYDVTIEERAPLSRAAALAQIVPVSSGASGVSGASSVAKQVVEERYAHLAAEVQEAAGADRLELDRRLQAAEREFPSDFRFTYERATLSVYGRADHHEAFFHLFRAAEKAVATRRGPEMLDRLQRDARPDERLSRLAVGHHEWSVLNETLENLDTSRLWHEDAIHRAVSHRASDSVPTQHPEDETPCIDALIALRAVHTDPEAEEEYRRLQRQCLRGSR